MFGIRWSIEIDGTSPIMRNILWTIPTEKKHYLSMDQMLSLKRFFLENTMHVKDKTFSMKIVSGCILVKKNLWVRGIQRDRPCAKCRETEESINHVFFECLLTAKSWLKGSFKPVHFPYSITLRKYRLLVVEGFSVHGWSSICLGFIVYLKSKKQ